MAIHAGRHPFGTDRGRILLRTLRDGPAAQPGHDLTMEATRWPGDEIAVTARKVLGADRHPEAAFRAGAFEPGGDGGGIISGTLDLAGRSRPVRLEVSQTGAGAYRASTSVVQSDFGITACRAFLGSLRGRDAVNVEVRPDLSDHPGAPR